MDFFILIGCCTYYDNLSSGSFQDDCLANAYSSADASHKQIYGEGNTIENFNHTEDEYGVAYQTSVFGNLKKFDQQQCTKYGYVHQRYCDQ